MNTSDLLNALKPIADLYLAQLREGVLDKPKEIEVVTFDLTTAKSKNDPAIINFPFKSFRVLSATDSNTSVYFLPYGKAGDSGEIGSLHKVNGTFISEVPLLQATFYWTAQSGKSITIELYRNSRSTPGNFLTSVSEVFSSFADQANVTVASTAGGTLIAAADADRKVLTLYNNSSTVGVWLGATATLVSGRGNYLAPNGYAEIKNTAAIYGITASSTASVSSVVEK